MLLRREHGEKCPFSEIDSDSRLKGCDVNYYVGWYHTDYTIPSEYFRPDVERPQDLRPFYLDFTYIHKPTERAYKEMTRGADRPNPYSQIRSRRRR